MVVAAPSSMVLWCMIIRMNVDVHNRVKALVWRKIPVSMSPGWRLKADTGVPCNLQNVSHNRVNVLVSRNIPVSTSPGCKVRQTQGFFAICKSFHALGWETV
jgi:hypothetical protein